MKTFQVHGDDCKCPHCLHLDLLKAIFSINNNAERVKELEEAIRDFTETLEKAGDYHEQNAVGLNFYRKCKQILDGE